MPSKARQPTQHSRRAPAAPAARRGSPPSCRRLVPRPPGGARAFGATPPGLVRAGQLCHAGVAGGDGCAYHWVTRLRTRLNCSSTLRFRLNPERTPSTMASTSTLVFGVVLVPDLSRRTSLASDLASLLGAAARSLLRGRSALPVTPRRASLRDSARSCTRSVAFLPACLGRASSRDSARPCATSVACLPTCPSWPRFPA